MNTMYNINNLCVFIDKTKIKIALRETVYKLKRIVNLSSEVILIIIYN